MPDNDEILAQISRPGNQEDPAAAEETEKYVIFDIDGRSFALPGAQVQEIVIDYEIFYLPFMPPYIRGLINRHGEPYTVIDLKILFQQQPLDGKKFIIIRDAYDKLSLLITDILKIVNIKKSSIRPVTAQTTGSGYFLYTAAIDNADIPVLHIDTVVKKIEIDVSR